MTSVDLSDPVARAAAVAAATGAIVMGSALCPDTARALATRAVDAIDADAQTRDLSAPPTPPRRAPVWGGQA